MASGLYKITNLINERFYVGSSTNIKSRWSVHLNRLRKKTHHNQFLLADFNKCGENSFCFETLEECLVEELIIKEQALLDTVYDNQKKCYNLRSVAESNRGRKISEETRLKMSIAKKGNKPSAKAIKASVERTKGKTWEEIYGTEQAAKMKIKMSISTKKRFEQEDKLLRSKRSKKFWEEPGFRDKMSEVHKKPCPKRRKKIIQLTLENKKINEFLGAAMASLETGVSAGNIRQVALGIKKTAGGFIWKYEE
jgi:group I intron endonuclease